LTAKTTSPGWLALVYQGRWLAANHQLAERGIGLLAGNAFAADTPSPQHCAMGAQSPDFMQLVADVQDAATLGHQLDATPTNNLSTACGVSTEVGSSKISSRGSDNKARMISTRCISPTLKVCTGRSGSKSRPYILALSTDALGHLGQGQRLVQTQPHVLRHAQGVKQAEMLEHHGNT
jgi:hypothetical protein